MTYEKYNLAPLPTDLSEVTTIDRQGECHPKDVGMTRAGVEAIWSAVEAYYRSGLQPAMSLVLRRHGQVVIRRAIGYASGCGNEEGDSPLVPITPETPICLFSASKAVTAMLIHKIAELGKIRLDEHVVDYLPEYGAHGKHATTIRHLLTHRAGIPRIPIKDIDARLLCDWDSMVQLLCELKPCYRSDEYQAYHAVTSGFVLGEILRRVAGESLPELMQRWIARPLGARHLTFGLPKDRRADAARNYCTGPRGLFPLALLVRRVLGVDLERVVEISNQDEYLSSVVPAGNIFATADEVCLFFQMMLNGGSIDGRRLFEQKTIEEAIRPCGSIRFDRTLLLPIRFSAGMVLGERPFGLYGPNCPRAFGHLGFMSCLCWADPDRDIAVGFLNTGKSISLQTLPLLSSLLATIGRHCSRLPEPALELKHA